MNRKVTVVGGAGNVGMTVARAIAEKELADVAFIGDKRLVGEPPLRAQVVQPKRHPVPNLGSSRNQRCIDGACTDHARSL